MMATHSRPAARGRAQRWIAALDRLATAENALVAFALTIAFVALFAAADRVLGIPKAGAISGPAPMTAAQLADLATAMGEKVRRATVFVTLVLDSFFPLAYGAALAFGSGYLLARLDAPEPWRSLRLLPVLAAAFDYLENVCIVLLLAGWPRFNAAAHPLSLLTRGKWLLIYASAATFVVAGVWLFARKVRAREV